MKQLISLLPFFIFLFNTYGQDTISIAKPKQEEGELVKNMYVKAIEEHIKINPNVYQDLSVIYIAEKKLITYQLPDSISGKEIIILSIDEAKKLTKKQGKLEVLHFQDLALVKHKPTVVVTRKHHLLVRRWVLFSNYYIKSTSRESTTCTFKFKGNKTYFIASKKG